jgi:MFS family permease
MIGHTPNPQAQASTQHERPYRVLAHRDFRLIWSAELLSSGGTQIQRVAVAWQVFELTHDPFQLGLLGLVRFVPLFLFGLVGGVVADRYDRRKTLIAVQLTQMIVAAIFAALTATDRISLPWIYALTAIAALLGAISMPTRHALVPTLVPTAAIPGAMTMGVLAMQSAGMVGPAVGGALVASTGVAVSYAIDAITFGIVALAALAIQSRPVPSARIVGGGEAVKEGLRFLRESPILLSTMVLDFVANFFGASTTLMPIFAADVIGGGPRTLGLLLSAPAVGAVAGSAVMAGRRPLARPGTGILGAIVVYGLALTAFALSRNLWLSIAFLAVSGVADAVSMSQRHTLRNLLTPDRLRGRVAAAHSTFAGGGPQLGEFEAGIVAAATSAPVAVALGGIGTVLMTLIIANRVPEVARFRWATGSPPPVPPAATPAQNPHAKDIDERDHRSI